MKTGLVWIRRDIRLHDHPALSRCINECDRTFIVFIFDPEILNPLARKSLADKRIHFISESLLEIQCALHEHHSGIWIKKGVPHEIIPNIMKEYDIDTLYFNRDYAPYPISRDNRVSKTVKNMGRHVATFKDHVIFEPKEVLKKDATAFNVFTPYANKWRALFYNETNPMMTHDCPLNRINNGQVNEINTVDSILNIAEFKTAPAFLKGGTSAARSHLGQFLDIMCDYKELRNYPALDKTSKLSVYIRHGCLSIRELVRHATDQPSDGSNTWLNELTWREFYQMILYHYPHVTQSSFKSKYTDLAYPGTEASLAAWKAGATGFPIIDAAMRCLNETGWMHNRLRMITASFLCKILLVDWKRGERYFAWKLLDYECASNNGGWQWSSSTGCDSAPYFRIFNPYRQSESFDSEGQFIKQWCPEIGSLSKKDIHDPPKLDIYPAPIVDYKTQRLAALSLYKSA